MSEASVTYVPRSILEPLNFGEIFGNGHPVEIELGSGDGTFIVDWAARNPAHNFIGIERLLGRFRKIERKARRAGLTNLRAVRIEASYLIEYLVPANSVSALHVYFPDPWPKRRHWRRRLVNPRFAELTARALVAGGVVYFRTDNVEYFEEMRRVFGGSNRFAEADTPGELAGVLTDFEREFVARGIGTRRCAYVRSGQN